MALTLSAVFVLGILTIAAIRARAVSVPTAIAVFLFGFFTAGTGAAAPITRLCTALIKALQNVT
ncbi:hypothetical protein [Streptomyces sp. URMC 123]|uniref:hypothetical protein n=1 Tax=Streptomyces sp. URMC 123 TaxID=3423403 RepID=UPI003F1C4761